MSIDVKICGLDRVETVDAAIDFGARWTGFVFYPPSPRHLEPDAAALLTARVTGEAAAVGLFVDPTDEELSAVLNHNLLDLIQLHGDESPARVGAVKELTQLPVMKVIKLAGPDDLTAATAYFDVADHILFDAKPPAAMTEALPGGNALSFDWSLLAAAELPLPWMLAGGLTADNVAEAAAASGATAVDISSGVEDSPGVKSIARIKAFLDTARAA